MDGLGKDVQGKGSLRKSNDASLALRWIKPLADEWLNELTLFHRGCRFLTRLHRNFSSNENRGFLSRSESHSLHSCRDSSGFGTAPHTHILPAIRSTTSFDGRRNRRGRR